jgi:hypothetical protein
VERNEVKKPAEGVGRRVSGTPDTRMGFSLLPLRNRTSSLIVIAAFATGLACDELSPTVGERPPDASARPPPPPPPREGCVRSGPFEGIETDPACVVGPRKEDAMRVVMKNLAISFTAEPPEVFAGGTSAIGITIKNIASVETTVLLEGRLRVPGPRPDWGRVVGIPEPKEAHGSEIPRLFFPMTTIDAHDRDVDALPTVAGSGGAPPPPTIFAVHLRPGAKLTHTMSWWALRIPAPAAIVQDEAGHRYIPKTAALALFPGEYGVVVELPLYGLTREERKNVVRVKVTKPPRPDAGRP